MKMSQTKHLLIPILCGHTFQWVFWYIRQMHFFNSRQAVWNRFCFVFVLGIECPFESKLLCNGRWFITHSRTMCVINSSWKVMAVSLPFPLHSHSLLSSFAKFCLVKNNLKKFTGWLITGPGHPLCECSVVNDPRTE